MAIWSITHDVDDGCVAHNYSEETETFEQSYILCGAQGAGANWGGFRFRAVDFAAGPPFAATLILNEMGVFGFGEGGRIYGLAADDAALFTSVWPTAQPKTAEWVAQEPAAEGADVERRYDVTAIVAEILGRPGWSAGNAIAFVFDHDGGVGVRMFTDFSSDPAKAARLEITLTRRMARRSEWLGRPGA